MCKRLLLRRYVGSKKTRCLLLTLLLLGVYYNLPASASPPRGYADAGSHHHAPLEERGDLDRVYNMSRVSETLDLQNITFLDNYYRYNYQAIETRIKKRMENVDEVCQQEGQPRSWEYNLFQFNALHVSWCPVFKSSSTTWKNFFIDWVWAPFGLKNKSRLNNHINLLNRHRLGHDNEWLRTFLGTTLGYWSSMRNGKQTYKAEAESNIRFTVVRHPFERLLSHVKSAGRDDEMLKMRLSWIQDSIIAGRINKIDKDKRKTYKDEFIQYVRHVRRGNIERSADNPYLNPPYPLVGELIDHIRLTGHSDGHWLPASEYCNICVHKFDYLIRLEEEPLELWYLVDKLGLWAHRSLFLNRANSSRKKETAREEVEEEQRGLTQEQRQFVNKYYDVDFRMFGYERL